jgi:polyferredoxin
MLYSLLTRSPLEMNVIHDRNPLFVKLSDGSIRNGYNITVINKHHEDKRYALSVHGLNHQEIRVQASSDIPVDSLPVFANSVGHFRVFLTADKQTESRSEIMFQLTETDHTVTTSENSIFVSDTK